jgi:hypothetical protein
MASGAEVLAHFEQVMQQRFLPSGRVRWMPMHDCSWRPDGAARLTSMVSGQVHGVAVRRKVVDATHARTEVPATHAPRYALAPGTRCVPLNALVEITQPYPAYTVVGAGKTGIDACLWLLEQGVEPARIRWIVPRDAWFLDRANFQPGLENFERNMAYSIDQFDAICEAASVADLFERLEARGALLRLDPQVRPTAYRCATVSRDELVALRRIRDVVRLGRLRTVEADRIVLEQGALPAQPGTLYIDCSASAIQPPPALPVFDGTRIHLFMVRFCQPLFSAALIARVEALGGDDAANNQLCQVVPSPAEPADWLRMWAVTLGNTMRWRQHPVLNAWLADCRLNGQAVMARGLTATDGPRLALLKLSGVKAAAAAARLPGLLAELS